MGMFDWIQYDGKDDFQTKDLENCLLNYEFRDGVLFCRRVETTWVDDETHRFGGYLKEGKSAWVPQYQYSGSVYFYRNTDRTFKTWEEYTAFIVDGKIIKIVEGDGKD